MTLAYALNLDQKIRFINIRTQKIDSFILEIFEMILISFQIKDKLARARFF